MYKKNVIVIVIIKMIREKWAKLLVMVFSMVVLLLLMLADISIDIAN